jgi:hypothetical protein
MKILGADGDEIVLIDSDKLRGPPGKDGASITGRPGARGPQGQIGLTGKPGKSISGKDGVDGRSIIGPAGKDGKDGADGRDGVDGKNGRDGKDAVLPGGGKPGDTLTFGPSGAPIWAGIAPVSPFAGPGNRTKFNLINSRLSALEASGSGATWATSTWVGSGYQPIGNYANSSDVSSFYALKTSVPVTASFAASADVSSFYALKTTDALKAASADVSSFYALKTSVPATASFAASADVSSANATFAQSSALLTTSIYVSSNYQPRGFFVTSDANYSNSTYIGSFYALKTTVWQPVGFYVTSNATYADSTAISSTYARFMGKTETWSLAAPASRTIANSIGWSFCTTSTTITSAFITMPTSPIDGQEYVFGTVGAITFITQTVGPGSVQLLRNPLTTAAAGAAAAWKWTLANTTWFRVR